MPLCRESESLPKGCPSDIPFSPFFAVPSFESMGEKRDREMVGNVYSASRYRLTPAWRAR